MIEAIKSGIQKFVATNLLVIHDPTQEQNPTVSSAYDAFAAPKKKKISNNEYIAFGTDDDLDKAFDSLLNKSATHYGILSKKAKMVAGNEMIVNGIESLGKSELMEWNSFYKRAGGVGKSLYNVFKRASFEYEKSGGFGLDITYDTGFKSIISAKFVPATNIRLAMPNSAGEITHVVIRNGGFKRTYGDLVAREDKVAIFDPLDESNLRQCMYISNPLSNNEYYGIPTYLAAYYFIAADFEFGKHILNSAKNGFSPKVMATFIGRNMSNEAKKEQARKFKANMSGSEGDQVIVSWVNKESDAPKIDTINVQNLDKMISVMSNLDDSKILTAHNVTSPTLFGIMVSGKLGGTGNELGTAYELFRTTETLPNRQVILSAFNEILSKTKFAEKLTLDIEDIKINFGTDTVESEQDEAGQTTK